MHSVEWGKLMSLLVELLPFGRPMIANLSRVSYSLQHWVLCNSTGKVADVHSMMVQVIVVNHLLDSGLCTAEELATDAAGQFPITDELGRIQVSPGKSVVHVLSVEGTAGAALQCSRDCRVTPMLVALCHRLPRSSH